MDQISRWPSTMDTSEQWQKRISTTLDLGCDSISRTVTMDMCASGQDGERMKMRSGMILTVNTSRLLGKMLTLSVRQAPALNHSSGGEFSVSQTSCSPVSLVWSTTSQAQSWPGCMGQTGGD